MQEIHVKAYQLNQSRKYLEALTVLQPYIIHRNPTTLGLYLTSLQALNQVDKARALLQDCNNDEIWNVWRKRFQDTPVDNFESEVDEIHKIKDDGETGEVEDGFNWRKVDWRDFWQNYKIPIVLTAVALGLTRLDKASFAAIKTKIRKTSHMAFNLT